MVPLIQFYSYISIANVCVFLALFFNALSLLFTFKRYRHHMLCMYKGRCDQLPHMYGKSDKANILVSSLDSLDARIKDGSSRSRTTGSHSSSYHHNPNRRTVDFDYSALFRGNLAGHYDQSQPCIWYEERCGQGRVSASRYCGIDAIRLYGIWIYRIHTTDTRRHLHRLPARVHRMGDDHPDNRLVLRDRHRVLCDCVRISI